MIDILFLLVVILVMWIWWRGRKGESMIPFLKQKESDDIAAVTQKKKNNKTTASPKQSKKLIRDLLGINDIRMDMLFLPKHEYVMALKCQPVNYHLRNSIEQEGIDVRFEQWLVSMNYPVVYHLQSRRLDLQQQVELYVNTVENDELLTPEAKEYCYMTIDYMNRWLTAQTRFETVRYVLFPYKLTDPGMKKTSNAERALQELMRRVTAAQNFLEGCGVQTEVCRTEDLAEMLYYALNRKRAVKARFKDVKLNEMLALYCTSPQDSLRIAKVKESIQGTA